MSKKHHHSGEHSNLQNDLQDSASTQPQEVHEESAVAPVAPADDLKARIEELEKELSECSGEKDSYYELLLRTKADFDNYRKRALRDQERAADSAAESALRQILPVLDNFKRAIESADIACDLPTFMSGVQLIQFQLEGALTKAGVKPFDSVGKPFDPTYHEAVMQVESDKFAPNIIADEIEKGYLYKDKLLRPAQVVVSRGPRTSGDTSETEQ